MLSKKQQLESIILTVSWLMEKDYRLRDNDFLLYKAFEAIENKKLFMGRWWFNKYKLNSFVTALEENLGTPPDTISRSRRVIQYNRGLLHGDRAKARKAAAEKFKNEIKKEVQ